MTGDRNAASGLRASGDVLGLLQLEDPDDWFHSTLAAGAATISSLAASATATNTDDRAQIEAAITERLAARKARDFARADAIRAEWAAKGIVFEDRPDGTTSWRRVERQLAGATMKGAGEVSIDAETKPRK